MKRLTADERRRCEDKQWASVGKNDNDRFARPPDVLIDPAEAAYFQAVLDAKHGPGHPPLFYCGGPISFGEGGSKLTKILKKKRLAERDHKPPHSLKLGALPCYIIPPSGPFDPEADVKPFEDFRADQRDEERFRNSYNAHATYADEKRPGIAPGP
jgi:hypothetical protein